MSKTITISDATWDKIKDQVEKEEGKVAEKKERRIEIKHRLITGKVIYSSDTWTEIGTDIKTTYKEAVEEAVSKGANLRGADLGDADLGGANLRDANLRDADLRGADLGDADLRDADLRGADLRGADFWHTKFYGKGGTTKIKKEQIENFLKALGIIVED